LTIEEYRELVISKLRDKRITEERLAKLKEMMILKRPMSAAPNL